MSQFRYNLRHSLNTTPEPQTFHSPALIDQNPFPLLPIINCSGLSLLVLDQFLGFFHVPEINGPRCDLFNLLDDVAHHTNEKVIEEWVGLVLVRARGGLEVRLGRGWADLPSVSTLGLCNERGFEFLLADVVVELDFSQMLNTNQFQVIDYFFTLFII